MKQQVWHISEYLHIKHTGHNMLMLYDENTGIYFVPDDIDNIIDALRRVKSHFAAKELAEQEKEKLSVWGKAKTPAYD